jgi:enoyl-[acyl-carrier protein] reductase III
MPSPAERGKTALITGGTRGVGRAIAHRLDEAGVATVWLNYLENDVAAAATAAELEGRGLRVELARANLAFAAEIQSLFERVSAATDRLDVFVHCAALTSFKPLHAVKANQWDLTMNVCARAFLHCVQGCLPLMPEGGSIVAISSTGSRRFNPNYGALGVAKATLEATVRYLAVELAGRGIRVNGVVPGLLHGDHLPPFPGIDAVVDETLRRTPAGRLGHPDDVAKAVVFLLTQADWMYGQNLVIDGGYCLT